MSENQILNLKGRSVIVRSTDFQHIIDLRHRVLRAGLPRAEAIFPGDELVSSYHFGAFLDEPDGPALCCATFHPNTWENAPAYQLRGMATQSEWVGQGLGSAVQNLALSTITTQTQIRMFWCNARLAAIPFYKKLGWTIASDLFEIPTAGPHYRMYLRSVPN